MNQQLCDPNRLSLFVRGELSDEAERELTAHLDECESCGRAIEHQVAEESAWREASAFLGDRNLQDHVVEISVTQSHDSQIEQVLSQLLPTDDPDSLGRIGGYEVTGVTGSGGMGVVLKAHDHSLDRVVAVKVMAPHLAASGSARQRFAREAKAAAAVLHPNVIAIHGVSNEQSLPYLVMPYVRGESLQKRIDAEGPLPLVDTLRIGAQVAAGLAAAHEQGLVHRDIKPGNILMEQGIERVTITDFGLARAVDDASLTRSGVIAGTPQYMSPEQARGEPIDARSDLFSLGSLLYAMCTGHSPFRAETSFGVIHRITNESPRPITEINPDTPRWLEAVVMKLLAKRAEDRFQSAEQVAELLEGCLSHTQHPATTPLPASVVKMASKSSKRRAWFRFVATGLFLCAILFAGVLVVLELNKGTLRIESEADDVPIRIIRGEHVVKELIVSKAGNSMRIAAGQYVVEIDQPFDKAVLHDNMVRISRGGVETITVTQVNKQSAMEVTGEISEAGHETEPSLDRSTFDVYLAEVEARHGKRFSEAERRAWRRHWLPRLLNALGQTNDADQKRSVAISALGLSNALSEFDTSEFLLKTLIQLGGDNESATAWQAELDGITGRSNVRVPASIVATPPQDSVLPGMEGFSTDDEVIVPGTGKVVAFAPHERERRVNSPVKGIVRRIGEGLMEGDRVKQGDMILEIEPNHDNLDTQWEASAKDLKTKLEAARAKAEVYGENIIALEAAKVAAVAAADELIAAVKAKWDAKERLVAAYEAKELQARLNYERQKALFDKGERAGEEIKKSEQDWNVAASQLKSAKLDVTAAMKEWEARKSERIQKEREAKVKVDSARAMQRDALHQAEKIEKQILEIDVKRSKLERLVIAAPSDGTLIRFHALERGVLKEGDELFTIVPDASERAVELWISGHDATLVQRGDNVRLQFEGWPAVESAGSFRGEVMTVDPNADGNGRFRILVKASGNDSWPNERYLHPGVRAMGWVLTGSRRDPKSGGN